MTVRILPETNQVSQFTLARFVKLANQLDALKAQHAALEQQLTSDLANGFKVESGTHTASLKTTERRNVSWRGVVERIKGSGYVRQVLSHTTPKTFIKLLVR